MGRKRRACARAARVAAVLALAAAALFARGRLGVRGAVSPGSGETGARGSTSASAGLTRVPTPDADAGASDEAVVSSPPADETVIRAGKTTPRVARLDAADAARRYGFAPNALVAATFATIEMADLLRNWVEHAAFVANFTNVAVVALDEATLALCADAFARDDDGDRHERHGDDAVEESRRGSRSLACVDASREWRDAFDDGEASRVRADAYDRTGPLVGHRENKRAFNRIGVAKTRVIRALLRASLTVLMSDVDVVWLRDPSRYLRSGQARRAHVAVSSDCVFGFEPGRPATDAFGQRPSPNNAEFNTGVLLLRPANATLSLVARWTASQLAFAEKHEMNDQSHFNAVVNAFGGRREVSSADGEVYDWDDEVDAEVAATIGGGSASPATADAFRVSDRELFPEAHERGLRPRYYETAAAPSASGAGLGDARWRETTSGRGARIALLPTGLFSNGHTFFVSRLAERSGVMPFAVHNTYQYSGVAGKIARFRESGLWAVDDAAYFGVEDERGANDTDDADERGGAGRRFLTLKYAIPGALADPVPSLRTPKGGTPWNHVDLMAYQVNRVRDGLALATALNRTLVLPPLLSTCDRWFNLLPNCTQGDARFPMIAPLDHVFLVFALDAFGGGGKYVEHGFLANRARFLRGTRRRREAAEAEDATRGLGPVARLEFRDPPPAGVRADDARGVRATPPTRRSESPPRKKTPFLVPEDFASLPGFAPADSATERAVAAVKRGAPRYFSAAFGSVASEIRATLGDIDAVRLLVVENLRPGAFAGFGAAEENAAFHEAMTPLAHEWCCRRNGTVPHLQTPYGEEEVYAYTRER